MANQNDKIRMSLEFTEAEMARLRDIAKACGYTIGRGPLHKEGSIQQFLDAVADGSLPALFLTPGAIPTASRITALWDIESPSLYVSVDEVEDTPTGPVLVESIGTCAVVSVSGRELGTG